MRWPKITLLLLPLIIANATAQWSWGGDENVKPEEKAVEKSTELLQGETLNEAQDKSISVDEIVDDLVNDKQGRSLRGDIDDVYSDPTIKDALDAGDDAEARDLIKGRLCNLGLIQCEDESEDTQEKRFLSPDELIYAQPVDIKPVGKPVASIAVRGPPKAYGPPKPMRYPPRPVKGPPPSKRPYGGNRPGFSDKYGVEGSNFQFSQSSSSNNFGGYGGNFVTKPPAFPSESPYAYENSKPSYNKPSSSSGTKTDVVQQHVHHHYVHSEADKDPKVIIKPIAIPVGSVGHLASQNFNQQSSSDIITASGGDGYGSISSGGFKPMSAPVYEPETIYGGQYGHSNGYNKGGSNVLSQSLPNQYQNNAFEDQKYGNSLGAYASQNSEFYKKELHVGSGNNFNQLSGNGYNQGSGNGYNQGSGNGYNQGSGNAYNQGSANSFNQGVSENLYNRGPASFGQSNNYQENYHSAKAQGFDCVCVNYDQCPAQEVIGRRDDLYLPIDPRNKGSEISALSDEQLDKLNATVVTTSEKENATESEVKKVSKRDVEEAESEVKKEAEPRLIGLSGYGGNGGHGDKKVQPTFGVSFGLPQPSHSGYPVNPFNANPIQNPYGPALNGGGLNLGLVSVNPLLAVQVTKNDYGEKVVKPFVNLHVTPNEHVVNKIGHLFHEKKQYLLNKHEHFHHYKPYYPHVPHGHYPSHPPVHHYGPPPSYHQHSHYRPPVYSPHYTFYKPSYVQPNPYTSFRENHSADDEYDNDDNNQFDDSNQFDDNSQFDDTNNDFYNPVFDQNTYGFERSANTSTDRSNDQNNYANRYAYSRSLSLPSKPGANRGGQTIRFPESRRKRETSLETPTETIEERQGYFNKPLVQQCRPNQVCCRRPLTPQAANRGQCGMRHSQGINGRIKTPEYVDGESEFGEYPWQVAILKKDPKESIYVCGGTLIDGLHIMTAAHCIKSHKGFDLRVRLGEWDVNRDVEFFPYVERDIVSVHVHPLYYAGTLDNDLAILKMDRPVEWTKTPHISPACLPDKYTEYAGQRCWTTGWGKDAFGQGGKYQNILKEVDVPVLSHGVCQQQLRQTRLGYNYELNPGFVCAGGEEGKDACKGDGGGPLVCERGGTWQLVGVVSWGIGCGEVGVPGVYVKVAHYLDWIAQVTGKFSPY